MSDFLPKLASPKTALVVVTATAVTAGVFGVRAHHHKDTTPAYAAGLPANAVTVDQYSCGANWKSAKPGKQNLVIANTGSETTEVYLVDPLGGAVYGELVGLAAGTTDELPVVLDDGTYALTCWPAEGDPVTGPAVTVSGVADANAAGPATPGVPPVSREDLVGPVKQYQAYVEAGLAKLQPMAAKLASDVAAGNLDAARADWTPAHQEYERLGGAYGAFGDAGDAIDGLPSGLPQGPADPGFAGFHRVEYGLWHGQSAAELAGPANALRDAVDKLAADFPKQQIDQLDLGLRAHEILEDTIRFELSGQADQGSGTSLATLDANVDGTRELLDILRPLLLQRDPALPYIDTALTDLQKLAEAQRHADGTWTPLAQLTTAQREAFNSSAGGAVEMLASVATICEPRLGSNGSGGAPDAS